jgi:hypothetical protein
VLATIVWYRILCTPATVKLLVTAKSWWEINPRRLCGRMNFRLRRAAINSAVLTSPVAFGKVYIKGGKPKRAATRFKVL